MGARVIAAASSDAKLELCKREGADELINYGSENLRARVKEITGGKGVMPSMTRSGAFSEQALRDMAWNGRFLVVGFATGDIPKVPMNLALLKNCAIVGVFGWRSRRTSASAVTSTTSNSRNFSSREKFDPISIRLIRWSVPRRH